MTVRINPSILSADFVNMERDLGHITNADFVHVDVMDNNFVPNLTFGPQMVTRIKDVSRVPLDVHLMIEDNDRWAPGYAELGAESVTFHVESTRDPVALATRLHEIGARAGLALAMRVVELGGVVVTLAPRADVVVGPGRRAGVGLRFR